MDIRRTEKLVSDYVDNYNTYMMDRNSELTEDSLNRMRDQIVNQLLHDLGYVHQDGIYESR